MIEKISEKILKTVITEDKTEEEKEILLFGITRIIEDIPKAVGIIIIGLLLGILKEMAIVTLVIMIYKTLTGGVHAKTNLGCFIYSVLFYLVIIYSAKYLAITTTYKYYIYALIYIFSVYTILVYVPADVPEIPKVNIKLRNTLKIKSFIALNVVCLTALVLLKDVIIQNLVILIKLVLSFLPFPFFGFVL